MAGLTLPEMPDLIKYDIPELDAMGRQQDKLFYKRSDKDFKRRHGGLYKAERLFEDSVLKDQRGDTELMPALQNEFFSAGLAGSLDAFGGGTGNDNVLAPGSGAEAAIGRSLGMDIMKFQDRNRANRQGSLALAEQLFPRRSIGMAGSDVITLDMLNTQGENAWSQAEYQTEAQLAQARYQQQINQGNADAAADAAQTGAMVQGGAAIAGAAVLALALVCWVARAVYGEDSSDWRVFRIWMLNDSPRWLRTGYVRKGPSIAKVVERSKALRAILRLVMDVAVKHTRARWA